MSAKAGLSGCLVAGAVLVAGVGWYSHRTPQGPFSASVEAAQSNPEGEYLARLADCVACHSTPDGEPFAGGLKMGTPMGTLYSTNITPDPETGIGRYSLSEFDNAVRRGVARDGHRLYPAMPYPSYAKLTDDDVRKLYGYFMLAVRPVPQLNLLPSIGFPWNQRWGLALWNGLFLPSEPYREKSDHDAAWNRGAYLVQGPGHCGACHTERGMAFNEKALDEGSEHFLGGALLDGWYASSLRGGSRLGLGRWTENDVVEFLKTGHNGHATVFGSMLDAFNNSTQFMTVSDLAAVARYLKSLPTTGTSSFAYDPKTQQVLDRGDVSSRGAATFINHCSTCHGRDGQGRGALLPPLAGHPAVLEADPSSLLNIILNGAGRLVAGGVPDSYRMTPFRVLLSDEEIADVASFIRGSWGNDAAPVEVARVRAMRESTDPSSDHVIVLRIR